MKKIMFFLVFVLVGTFSFAYEIDNKQIQTMVDRCVELNNIKNPDLIQPKQMLQWEFPDNKDFQFYKPVVSGQSLWRIADNLLFVTKRYREISEFNQVEKDSVNQYSTAIDSVKVLESKNLSASIFDESTQKMIRENNKIIIRKFFYIILIVIFVFLMLLVASFKWEDRKSVKKV